MKIKYIFFSIFLIPFSFFLYQSLNHPEVPLKIKILDLSLKIIYLYTGLGTPNFSRSRLNEVNNFLKTYIKHSLDTHIETLRIPSLIDDYQIEAKIYINKKSLKQENIKLPTIIYIHGGGWVIDNSDTLFIDHITDNGMVVVEIKYRLAPEHKFPTAIEDCYSVVQSENIFKYSDQNKLALMGDSAGGSLVSSLILMIRNRKPELFRKIQYQILFYPATLTLERLPSHQKYENWYVLTGAIMNFFHNAYLNKQEDNNNEYFNPSKSANLSGLPEIYIVLSERDYLNSEGKEFANLLENAGNTVTLKEYSIEHGFLAFDIEQTKIALNEIFEFLSKKKFI